MQEIGELRIVKNEIEKELCKYEHLVTVLSYVLHEAGNELLTNSEISEMVKANVRAVEEQY